MKPCDACPWLSKEPRDVAAINQPKVKAAAMVGSFFCCHVNMGPCAGVKVFRANELKREAEETK